MAGFADLERKQKENNKSVLHAQHKISIFKERSTLEKVAKIQDRNNKKVSKSLKSFKEANKKKNQTFLGGIATFMKRDVFAPFLRDTKSRGSFSDQLRSMFGLITGAFVGVGIVKLARYFEEGGTIDEIKDKFTNKISRAIDGAWNAVGPIFMALARTIRTTFVRSIGGIFTEIIPAIWRHITFRGEGANILESTGLAFNRVIAGIESDRSEYFREALQQTQYNLGFRQVQDFRQTDETTGRRLVTAVTGANLHDLDPRFSSAFARAAADFARRNPGVTMAVTSGYRDRDHNKRVGGSQTSFHQLGLAADIRFVTNDGYVRLSDPRFAELNAAWARAAYANNIRHIPGSNANHYEYMVGQGLRRDQRREKFGMLMEERQERGGTAGIRRANETASRQRLLAEDLSNQNAVSQQQQTGSQEGDQVTDDIESPSIDTSGLTDVGQPTINEDTIDQFRSYAAKDSSPPQVIEDVVTTVPDAPAVVTQQEQRIVLDCSITNEAAVAEALGKALALEAYKAMKQREAEIAAARSRFYVQQDHTAGNSCRDAVRNVR